MRELLRLTLWISSSIWLQLHVHTNEAVTEWVNIWMNCGRFRDGYDGDYEYSPELQYISTILQ
jgi:hypothetical protein